MLPRRTFLTGSAAVGALALLGCSRDAEPEAPAASPSSSTPSPSPTPTDISPRLDGTVAEGLDVPWGITFLAGGDALVSQRDAGSIVRVGADGSTRDLGTVPGSVGRPGGEGGLLGLTIDPEDDAVLFAYVTTSTDNRVVRIALDGDGLGEPQAVLTGIPLGGRHHGGRLAFGPDGHLYVATGEAGIVDLAQQRDSLGGKILRVDRDGEALPGNPFDTRLWSYGHRNVQGLAFDADGRLWASEFGDKTADELNLIEAGGNYGWPEVEGEADDDRFVDPAVTWATDDCSPSGLAITRSTAFVAALQGECLWAVPLTPDGTGEPEALLRGELGRIRTVVVAPDDSLWVTTSNTDGRGDPREGDDRILRVTL